MFDRFICCFTPRNIVPPVVKLTTTTTIQNKNVEENDIIKYVIFEGEK